LGGSQKGQERMKTIANIYRKHIAKHQEALIWVAALVALALLDPTTQHASICPLSLMELDFCPGCGLGHSIAYMFRGEFALSFQTHPLGMFAAFMLTYRIVNLTYKNFLNSK